MIHVPEHTRTHVEIDGRDFLLAPGQDLVELMERIEEAAQSPGTFVHFQTAAMSLSALISTTTHVMIGVEVESATDPPLALSEFMIAEWEY